MDVRRVIRERRLQEAAEEIRRNSNSDQQGNSIPRSSHLHSARSSMPSLSQYGDAESYQIGEPEETAEWYEHDETGNQTQVYEPKGSARSPDKNTDVGLDTVAEEEGLPFSPHLTQRSQPRDTQRSQPRENLRQAQVQPRDEKGQFSSPAILKLQKQLEEEREMRKKEIAEERGLRNELRDALQQTRAELDQVKAMKLVSSGDRQPTPQVITVKTEEKIDSKKLVIPALSAKDEPELERWLVKARTGVQVAAPGSGLSMLNKAEAVAKMNVEDWRDTAAHRRGDIELRSPGYSRTEKNAEEELGSTIISKLPVEAQQHAQKMAEAKGGAMELHVALAKTFLMIMVTTSDERDAVVDELKKKQNVPAKKVLQFMKQYKLDYDRVILGGFVQETEDHNKFFKAVQHAALNPERAASSRRTCCRSETIPYRLSSCRRSTSMIICRSSPRSCTDIRNTARIMATPQAPRALPTETIHRGQCAHIQPASTGRATKRGSV